LKWEGYWWNSIPAPRGRIGNSSLRSKMTIRGMNEVAWSRGEWVGREKKKVVKVEAGNLTPGEESSQMGKGENKKVLIK